MPTVPTNPHCSHLGCKHPRTKYSTSCLEHGGRDTQPTYRNDERDKAHGYYLTAQWARQRARQLSSQPICQSCLTRLVITPATEVDHVFPWRRIGADAFYRNLFQSLCHACHSHKTQQEKKDTILSYANGIVVTYRVSDYQRVVGVDNP
jgi:5-methylcytosine-specific restriction protein A